MKYKIFLYHIYIYVYNDFRNLVSRKETSDWVFRGSNFLLLLADEWTHAHIYVYKTKMDISLFSLHK